MKKIVQCRTPDSTQCLQIVAGRDSDSAGTLNPKSVRVITEILMDLLELVCTVKMVAMVQRAKELAGLIISITNQMDVQALGFMSI